MSMYPPGVTGNEFQIAGPDSEQDEDREVGACGREGCDFEGGEVTGMLVTFGREAWFDWECPNGHRHQDDEPEDDYFEGPDEPDYDDEPDYY